MTPTGLEHLQRFVCWRLEPRPGKKPAKVPFDPRTGERIDPHQPAAWMTRPDAEALAATAPGAGVGYVLVAADNVWCVDLDEVMGTDGQWLPIVADMVRRFPGCYVEVSNSGRGVHMIGYGQVPTGHRTRQGVSTVVEFYSTARFIALTGHQASGNAWTDHTAAIVPFLTDYALLPRGDSDTGAMWSDEPRPEWNGPEDNKELIEKAVAAVGPAAAFGGKASFADLWFAHHHKLAASYPSAEGGYDASAADAALVQHLCFWTGCDCERIDALFRMSALYRDKWDREDYRVNTILGGVSRCCNVYTGPRGADGTTTPMDPHAEARMIAAKATMPTAQPVAGQMMPTPDAATGGLALQSIPDQVEHFAGCTYISKGNRVFTPFGFMSAVEFENWYAGFEFIIDRVGKVTKNAFEAFARNRAHRFPKAMNVCFRPELAPGTIVEEEGHTLLNTYQPCPVHRTDGDVTPYLTHLAKLIPHPDDRAHLLAYMAAMVQHPGAKFQWCPLIQGAEGNGKTFLTMALEYAIGERYSFAPNASVLGDGGAKFNSWIENKLYIRVEEVYAADRNDILEALKPLITNRRIEIQGKGTNQITGDNRANFVMCSNHKDAIRKTPRDRRYAIFYTAQQNPGDIERDGMSNGYFSTLWDWGRAGGFAAVAGFLMRYAIPDAINPAKLLQRAPATTSTEEAYNVSLGGIEQAIMESVEEDRAGFCGGWISSIALDKLLSTFRRSIAPNKRKQMLADMGYIVHPGLLKGRATTLVAQEDGRRPVLYAREGTPLCALSGADAMAAYMQAQGYGALAPVPQPG